MPKKERTSIKQKESNKKESSKKETNKASKREISKASKKEIKIRAIRVKDTDKPAEKSKLKVISLGGLGEIGKNITVIEYENDIIIVDCGLGFPDEEMLGIDLVIPDVTYLEENAHKIRGLILTHGHEDHIGAIPYVLRQINPPIYGTRLTLGILQQATVPSAVAVVSWRTDFCRQSPAANTPLTLVLQVSSVTI